MKRAGEVEGRKWRGGSGGGEVWEDEGEDNGEDEGEDKPCSCSARERFRFLVPFTTSSSPLPSLYG